MVAIDPSETLITGKWLVVDDGVIADEATDRIDRLVTEHLSLLGRDSSGWDTLYRDPADGRLWEHTYPQSGMHGGGPPQLQRISPADAKAMYGSTVGASIARRPCPESP